MNSFVVLLLCFGFINAQERSISGGGSRRNQFSAGKPQVVGFNCPEDFGYYAHPSDCSQYYVCVFGGALLESCTGGLMYSNELQTCDWPRNVVCNNGNGPGISTVKITDPRTSVRSGNQVLSATESVASSSLKRGVDNTIRSREPVKSSGTSKSVFDDSSKLRQGRFILGQESTNQNFNTGFQAQETSSRAFNVVAASPSPKFVFPPLLPGASSNNRFAAPTVAPVVAPVPASSAGGASFYNDLLNLNDTDYYYYYDDILYDDYYEPTVKTTPKPRQSSRSRGNSPDLANLVNVASSVSNKGRGSSSRLSSPPSSPISPEPSFNSSPSSSFLGSFASPPARSTTRTGGEASSFAKQTKKASSKTSSPTRPPINQHSLATPKPDSTSIDPSSNQRSSTAPLPSVPTSTVHSSQSLSSSTISPPTTPSTPTTTLSSEQTQTINEKNITISTSSKLTLQDFSNQNKTFEHKIQDKEDSKNINSLKKKSSAKTASDKTDEPSSEPKSSFSLASQQSSFFPTSGSGPFAPPGASPRIRFSESNNAIKNLTINNRKLLSSASKSSSRSNHRIPFNLATITFDLLRERSRSLKDSNSQKSISSRLEKNPNLFSVPVRSTSILHPLTVKPQPSFNRSAIRKATFSPSKLTNESKTSAPSPRLKGSAIPSPIRLVTSQPSPRSVSPSQRNTSDLQARNLIGPKSTRRISAPIPKRINIPTTTETGKSSLPTLQRSPLESLQVKRITTSQTLFKQMLNIERDNIIAQDDNVRIRDAGTTLKPTRMAFASSPTAQTVSFLKTTTSPSKSFQNSTTFTQNPVTNRQRSAMSTLPLILSTTATPRHRATTTKLTTTKLIITTTLKPSFAQRVMHKMELNTEKTTILQISQNSSTSRPILSKMTATAAPVIPKSSTVKVSSKLDNLSRSTETPKNAFNESSFPIKISKANETSFFSAQLRSPNPETQFSPRFPVKLADVTESDAMTLSGSSPLKISKDTNSSSNFATITVAQLRSKNSDQKSILHPPSNLTHASLVNLTALKPFSTPIRPSIAPSQLNFTLNRPTPVSQLSPARMENNESTLFNSSQETGPDRGSSSQSSSKASQSGSPELVGKGPQRLIRPSKKPPPVSTRGSLITDIWKFPPRRPAPVYPQPQVDTLALPCDPTVCKLPDCYCGQSAVPGNIPAQNVPQMVLLTFDDSVNDLNKKLYVDLFEKGRVNPNGCPIAATYYVSHEWTDYSQVQNLYSDGHEIASHSITHSFGEKFSTEKWAKEVGGQREIMSAYGGVRMEDIRGMRAPFLAIGGNNMFRMLYDLNFTYDSSMPVYENRPPSWPYTLDYKIFHDCMIPPCPTHSYPGVWQVPMVMWQDLNGGRCSMGDACTTPPDAEGVYKFLIKNFERHYTTNRSPLGLYYHAAWFTTPHHKEGFIAFLDTITAMDDVWLVTSWQSLEWVRNPVPLSQAKSFKPFQCDYPERPPRCTGPKVCNVWHKGSVRYLKTCQQCPESYPWVGNTGVQSPLNDV